ncbi:MAG: nitrilase [Actinomycetia bacterium]|nr:nitrilase [Actinomycetes bacterium]
MKLLLAALRCEKGDIAGNRRAHERVVAAAFEAGADIVVFPEMSLTGSVDPRSHPAHLAALDDPEVLALAAATRDTRLTVVFGVAERAASDAAHITQCVARGGELVGAQRKRHLGEGEEGFTPARTSGTAAVFEHDGARFGIVICAESQVAFPSDDAVDAGAGVVLFCAAPGLDPPRRRSDDAWRDALSWWESAGLADMCGHAARRRVWVAVATQAGATHDEDFPGLAALVDPSGAVTARLPDWREGTLLVDIPFV